MAEDNKKNELNMNVESTEDTSKVENIKVEDIKNEDVSETINNGECWALVCYTEKTLFQKITYSLRKLIKYTKNRILGKA